MGSAGAVAAAQQIVTALAQRAEHAEPRVIADLVLHIGAPERTISRWRQRRDEAAGPIRSCYVFQRAIAADSQRMVEHAGREARGVVKIEAVAVDLVLERRAGLHAKRGIDAVDVRRDECLTILCRGIIDMRAEIDQWRRWRLVSVAERVSSSEHVVVEACA